MKTMPSGEQILTGHIINQVTEAMHKHRPGWPVKVMSFDTISAKGLIDGLEAGVVYQNGRYYLVGQVGDAFGTLAVGQRIDDLPLPGTN